MTNTERILEALEFRMEQMTMDQDKVRAQIVDLTGSLLKLNYELSDKLGQQSALKGCIRKMNKFSLNPAELEESRKLFEKQLELIEIGIQTNKVYTEAMSNKIEELKMVHEDLTADIEAIGQFVDNAKKEPIQPLVAVNESA